MYNLIMKSLSLLFICLVIYFKFFIFAIFASQEVSDDDGFEVSDEILAISFNPFASNQGAVAHSNPFPKVLSGDTIYQWQAVSGTSTAHFDQLSFHCGTCTQSNVEKSNETIELNISLYFFYITAFLLKVRLNKKG